MKDFKAFILRGNVVELAIAVAIGAAFGALVTSFTTNLLTPLLAIPGDAASFADMKFTISGSNFLYGAFIDSIITFVIVAAVLFFAVVRPLARLQARRKTEVDVADTTRECPECLSSIPIGAHRCAFCTAAVASV